MRSIECRLLQRVSLIVEYKDNRGAPPPLHVILGGALFVHRIYRGCCGGASRKEVSRGARGFSVQRGQAAAAVVSQRERQYRSLYLRRQKERRNELLESKVDQLARGHARQEADERAHFEAITGRFDKQAS